MTYDSPASIRMTYFFENTQCTNKLEFPYSTTNLTSAKTNYYFPSSLQTYCTSSQFSLPPRSPCKWDLALQMEQLGYSWQPRVEEFTANSGISIPDNVARQQAFQKLNEEDWLLPGLVA